MPIGTRHEVTGLLLGQRGGFVLDAEGGGTWRLEVSRKARHLLGQRVTVVGVRDAFDLLVVETITKA
ncbi:DUF5818 domain-containing protein [Sphingomonas donggukensis]|uniref:DUF5818 domain-containing protein n=1 Tax=Sphingomonas donggukensis TaxID=2949093 RepID=A0ABY4TV48_9SPHN|nr:DUF5818 domain-containing protein [Sphingomonas donggukensis]URW75049.1 DUF5818 domain-containing protein [Sphingomonas donggukensis]